ncbi:MAG: hypothetical protein AB1641_01695 [Thermodesulfobacteriota bacterium]
MHPLHMLGAAEVAAVFFLLQPSALAVGFADFTAEGVIAVALPSEIPIIRQKQLFPMTTFLSRDSDYQPVPPCKVDVTGSFNGGGIKPLEENAEENKKWDFIIGFLEEDGRSKRTFLNRQH